jgi:hypothetical protein
MSGRKGDEIWQYFLKKIVPGKSGSTAICKVCKHELQGLVARLKKHREKCKGVIDNTIVAVTTSTIVVYLMSSCVNWAYSCQKKSNLHTNELHTTFFCSTRALKAPNRLKSLKLAPRFVLTSCDIYQNPCI